MEKMSQYMKKQFIQEELGEDARCTGSQEKFCEFMNKNIYKKGIKIANSVSGCPQGMRSGEGSRSGI